VFSIQVARAPPRPRGGPPKITFPDGNSPEKVAAVQDGERDSARRWTGSKPDCAKRSRIRPAPPFSHGTAGNPPTLSRPLAVLSLLFAEWR
jgi:hypothetical protein